MFAADVGPGFVDAALIVFCQEFATRIDHDVPAVALNVEGNSLVRDLPQQGFVILARLRFIDFKCEVGAALRGHTELALIPGLFYFAGMMSSLDFLG